MTDAQAASFKGQSGDSFTITAAEAISVSNAVDLADKTSDTVDFAQGVTGVYADFSTSNINTIKGSDAAFNAVVTDAISVAQADTLNAVANVTAKPEKFTDTGALLVPGGTVATIVSTNPAATVTVSNAATIDQITKLESNSDSICNLYKDK